MRSAPGCSSIVASVCRICTRRSPGFGRLRAGRRGAPARRRGRARADSRASGSASSSESSACRQAWSQAGAWACASCEANDSCTHICGAAFRRGVVAPRCDAALFDDSRALHAAAQPALHPDRAHADAARRLLVLQRVFDQHAARRRHPQPCRQAAKHARIGLGPGLAEHAHVLDRDHAVEAVASRPSASSTRSA